MDSSHGVISMSPQPLYLQLKEVLRGYILDGTYAPHSKLPSENELIKQYKVSRITVRQALRDLQKEGLIFSIQGKGSFVTKPKAVQDLTRLQGFGEAMSRHGMETYSKVVSIKRLPADKFVAAALNLDKGQDVFEYKRIRYLNRSPVSLDISYFDVSIGDRLQKEDLVTRDIFEILENNFGLALESADLTIEATIADDEKAQLLKVEPNSPLLRLERLTFSRGHVPVDFEYLYYIGDFYKYRLRVERERL
ncbi:MAG: UTRA domain-containing protein [Gammaproteobacteria bacterium]|nr:UTRA domain-containing protein [Gammaproteobacteria bacterium]